MLPIPDNLIFFHILGGDVQYKLFYHLLKDNNESDGPVFPDLPFCPFGANEIVMVNRRHAFTLFVSFWLPVVITLISCYAKDSIVRAQYIYYKPLL